MFSFWHTNTPDLSSGVYTKSKRKVTLLDEPFIIEDYLPREQDYSLLPNQPFKPQKNVVKSAKDFTLTGERHKAGRSKPHIATKLTKDGELKLFVLKSNPDFPGMTIAAKVYFDLLSLCGVTVPKTYLVKNDAGQIEQIASHMKPGYLDLLHYLDAKSIMHETIHWDIEKLNAILQSQTIRSKPIKGLFENIPVFVFLLDYDAIGPSFTNVGLIENEDHMQAVKIDPDDCKIRAYNDDESFKIAFEKMIELKLKKIPGSIENKLLFQHARPDQIRDGMQRVANLTNFQLSRTINNNDFPHMQYWGKTEKAEALKTLIARRDTFKTHLAKQNATHPKPK